MRVAFCSMAWNTDFNSPGDELITRKTSEVATCCSSASFNSRWRRATSDCLLFGKVPAVLDLSALLRFAFTGLSRGGLAALPRDVDRRFMLAPKLLPRL